MSEARDVAGTQPPLLYPAYQSTLLRAPSKPLIQLPRDFTDLAAPLFGYLAIGETDNDLTRQHSGEPVGERIVVAGRVLDELFARAPDRHDVTILGAEPRVNYDRIMLSPVLSGEKAYADIITHDAAWYARHGIHTRFGETVTAIDRKRVLNKIVSADGEK